MDEEHSSEADDANVAKRVDEVIDDVTSGRVGMSRTKKLREVCEKRLAPPAAGPPILDAIRRSWR